MNTLKILAEQMDQILRSMIEMIPQLLIALVIILITFGLSRLVRLVLRRSLARSRLRPSLKSLFALLSSILVWTVGLMLAALVLFPNLTPTKLLAGLGIGSVAIGFAFKDILENFLAGIIILWRREMRIGDYIISGDIEGFVEDILVRETHIRCSDGQLVIVPNSNLFKNPLWIVTDRMQRRVSIQCGVAYSEDIDAARQVIRDAVEQCQGVITDPNPVQVFASEFGDSSINFEVSWWTGSKPVEERKSRDSVVAAIKRALDDAGIEIPFPYRTLTVSGELPVRVRNESRSQGDEDSPQ